MCRLLGLIANREVDLTFSLLEGAKTLRSMSVKNADGWGLGWYEGGRPRVIKEPRSADGSRPFQEVAIEGRARIFVGHVRRATTGDPHVDNCHPFQHDSWLFAHNGSVDRDSLIGRLDEEQGGAIRGQTDSEVYFHWILQSIAGSGSVQDGILNAVKLAGEVPHTGLNFLLSDGTSLYAFRGASTNPSYYSLSYLRRNPNASQANELRSSEVQTLIHSKALRGEEAILVASEKLTNEPWQEIPLARIMHEAA